MKQSIMRFLLFALFLSVKIELLAFEVDGICYISIDDQQVLVESKIPKYEGDIVIPSEVVHEGKTYSVTSVGFMAFRECRDLVSVTIPNSVTSIAGYAFSDCSGLTSVTIGNNLIEIGYLAFSGCKKLTSVNIPNSVTFIDRDAFLNCSSLTSVSIPSGLTSIESGVFMDCSSLTSVNIPKGVTSIGERAFSGCTGLTSVTIPNSVISIGKEAFSGCNALTSVTIPNSVVLLGNGAFSSCGFTSMTIPNSVTSIGDFAFSGCSGLTSVTIPNSVVYIGNWAFADCSFTSVTIPNSVTSIADYAFCDCSLTSVNIPNSVTSIGNGSFRGCHALTSVTIPNSVISIGNEAFEYCNSITSIKSLNKTPPQLASYVFTERTKLNAILYVPKGYKTIYSSSWGWTFVNIVELEDLNTALNKGDSNGDGILNVADIVEVANYIMGNPSNTFVKDLADINNDGVVNATDIIEIVKIIMSPDNQATTDNEIDNFGDYDDTEYFEININGETFTDDTWGGSWLANYETKTKNGVEVYPYGGLSETIMISDQDGLQYAILAGYTSENLKTVFPKSKGTYDVISSRGNYFISDYSDNVGMVISGGNMNRRTVTSGSLKITNVSKYKEPNAKDYLGREEMYATEGTFSFTLKDDWDGNENMISGKFRLVF